MSDEDYTIDLTFKEQQVKASEAGCTIKLPKSNELFLDIDNVEDFAFFKKHITDLGDLVQTWNFTESKSGKGHYHIIVTLNRKVKSLTERVLLQAVLGSDRVRELISWRRLDSGNRKATVFFEKGT